MTEVGTDSLLFRQRIPTQLDQVFWPVLLIDQQQQVVLASPAAVQLFAGDPCGSPLLALTAREPVEVLDLVNLATVALDPQTAFVGAVVFRCFDGKLLSVEIEAQPFGAHPGWVLIWIYPITRAARRTQLLLLANQLAPKLLAAINQHELYRLVLLALYDLGMIGSIALLQPDGTLLQDMPFASHLVDSDLPTRFVQTQLLLIQRLQSVSWPAVFSQITALPAPLLVDSISLPSGISALSLSGPLEQQQQSWRHDWPLPPLMVAALGHVRGFECILLVCAPGMCHSDGPFVAVLANYLSAALQQIKLRDQMEAQIGRLELIIHHVPDTLLVVRSDMTMTLLNEKPLRAAGYLREDIEGRPITEIVLPRHRDQLTRSWEAARRGETQRLELDLLRRDGTTMICAVTAGRIPGSDEVLAIVTDMTVRQQLFQAEKMAALGRLVAGVAHELNNPMAVILGLVQLNLLDVLPPQLSDDLRNIEQATLRASKIVQQLTTFVRPHGARPLPIDLIEIVPDVAEKFRLRATLLDAQIVAEVEPHTPQIKGDVFQIQQVLMNLLSNALQAVERQPEGQLRLIRLRSWGEGQRVRIMVSDTGSGIAPELLSRIFEPFFTTRAVGQGVGLGLAIAYAIIQQHSGQIWAENDLTSGTVFHISLPTSSNVDPEQE